MAKKMHTGTDIATVSNDSYKLILSDVGDGDIMIRTEVGSQIMTHTIFSVDLFSQLIHQLQPESITMKELESKGLL
jgi:hypothetical protein